MNNRLKVLVADDQDSQRTMLVDTVRRLGYECEGVSDGDECVGALGRKSFDVLFLDLVMPRMDGVAVLKAVRERWPGLPTIVTSVQDAQDSINEILSLGATGYLVKPFAPEVIADVMRTMEQKIAPGTGPQPQEPPACKT